jgi:hypothetical protein
MQALQLWLPMWGPSLNFPEVARDAQRAFRAWQGEQTVWLLQGLQEAGRWREGQQWQLALPAELLDCVDVYHVGENGVVYGPNAEARFPNGRVQGLLEAWLNVEQSGGCDGNEHLSASHGVCRTSTVRRSSTSRG